MIMEQQNETGKSLSPLTVNRRKSGGIMKRIAIYTRVSTGKQDTENQAEQLRDFASRQGWQVVGEFTDVVSGTKSEKNRPQFARMMEAAYRREFDLVLFWALDRFSREGVLPTLKHLERLNSYGVDWRSYSEQYLDSTGIFKDAVISILATIGKQENIRRSERIHAGLRRARRAGKKLGRPFLKSDRKASRTTLWRRSKAS
jgi:DNA invertase Pin-like site-specific DNA recombinase